MFLKIKIFLFLMLFSVGAVFAGEVVKLECDTCGFKSNNLFLGGGKFKRGNIAVYCDKCKNFYAVVSSAKEASVVPNKAVEPIGAGNVSQEEGNEYFCPKCNSEAVVYESKVCPICKKGALSRQRIGLWD